MPPFVKTMGTLLDLVLAHPANAIERAVTLLAGAVIFIIILQVLAKLFNFGLATLNRAAIILVAGGAILLATGAAAMTYIPADQPRNILAGVAVGVAFLVLVTPLAWFLLKSRYHKVMLTLLLSAAAAAVAILLTAAAFDAFSAGSGQVSGLRQHNEEIEGK